MPFGAILRQGDKKYQENHWVFYSKQMTFRDLRELNFSLGKSAFREMKKRVPKTL